MVGEGNEREKRRERHSFSIVKLVFTILVLKKVDLYKMILSLGGPDSVLLY